MESQIIEIASGSLSAMNAMTCLLAQFGKDSLRYTLIPAIQKQKLTGKALGDLFHVTCEQDASVLGQKLCPLLCIRPTQSPTLPPIER